MPLIEECSDSSDDEQKEEVVPSEEADAAAKTRVVEGIRQGLHPACLGAWIDVPARKTPSHPAAMGFSEPLVRDAKHASESKEEGNRFFKATDFESAVDCYTRAVDLCPFGEEHDYARSVYHGNRAQGYLSLSLFEDAVDDCDAAVRLQPRFVKAFMRRAQAKEALGRLEEAVADVKAVLEIDPTIGTARASCERLEAAIKKKNDEMKDEMLGKLKDLGNTLLGKVGLSMDNFQMQQDPNTGSYSINFQQ